MKRIFLLLALSVTGLPGQSLDFSSLDKLAAKAKEVSRVSLDGNQIRAVAQMMLSDKTSDKETEQIKKLLAGLISVDIRTFEFSKTGQYQETDLKSIRAQIASLKNWAPIVDTKEDGEHTEIYMLTEGGISKGVAVVSAEPAEVSVIFIKGTLRLSDLGALGSLANLPVMSVGPNGNAAAKK